MVGVSSPVASGATMTVTGIIQTTPTTIPTMETIHTMATAAAMWCSVAFIRRMDGGYGRFRSAD